MKEKLWSPIRGNVNQMNVRTEIVKDVGAESIRSMLVAMTDAAMREQMKRIGVKDVDSLYLVEMKLLRAKPGQGHQPTHYDIPVYDDAADCYSNLLYLDDTHSTSMPRQTAEAIRHMFSVDDTITNAEKKRNKIICDDANFISVPVVRGQMMSFATTVPHAGVMNQKKKVDRVVPYGLYSRSNATKQGDVQRFPNGTRVKKHKLH